MKTAFLLICCVLAYRLEAQIIQPSDSQKIILTSLNKGDTIRVGDTVSVNWVCIDNVIAVDIRISLDKGKTWILLNGSSISYMDVNSFGHWKWVVPAKIKDSPDTTEFELAGNNKCLFRVENYSPHDNSEISISAKPVTILAQSGVIVPDRRAVQIPAFNFRATQSASPAEANGSIRFFDARGRAISINKGMASGIIFGVHSGEANPLAEAQKTVYENRR